MKIGIMPPFNGHLGTPPNIITMAKACEEAGFHSLWVPEHVVLFDQYESKYPYSSDGRLGMRADGGVMDPFNVLSFVAAVTTRIRLGTGICLVPQRNPVYTAKAVATLDVLSGGRVDFGIGIGWLREEFEVLDVPWERRGARTLAYLEVMRRLWCDEESSYEGEFYRLQPTRQYPKPVQSPHPPVHVGGESDAALRRVAAAGQGWYGFDVAPGNAKGYIEKLTAMLEAKGRARSDVTVSISPFRRPASRELVEQYAEAGVDQLNFPVGGRTVENVVERIQEMASETM